MILSWQAHLTEEEMPPRWMWHLPKELEIHFEHVKEERDRKYNSDRSSSSPGAPMVKNELAKGRGRNS